MFDLEHHLHVRDSIYTIYQALPSQRDNPKLTGVPRTVHHELCTQRIWTFAWHYEFYFLSVLFTVGILLTIIGIYVRAGIGKPATAGENACGFTSRQPLPIVDCGGNDCQCGESVSLLWLVGVLASAIRCGRRSVEILIAARSVQQSCGGEPMRRAQQSMYGLFSPLRCAMPTKPPSPSPPTRVSSSSSLPLFWGGSAFVRDGGNRPYLDPASKTRQRRN